MCRSESALQSEHCNRPLKKERLLERKVRRLGYSSSKVNVACSPLNLAPKDSLWGTASTGGMEYNWDVDVVLMKLQAEEISRVIQEASDLEFAYLLQLHEAEMISVMMANQTGELLDSQQLLLLTSEATCTTTQPMLSEDRQVVLREQTEEVERLNQELEDTATAVSEQSHLMEIDAIIEHDLRFARSLAALPEVEWGRTGEEFSDPFVADEDLKAYPTVIERLTLLFPQQGIYPGIEQPASGTLFISRSLWEPTVLAKAFISDADDGENLSTWAGPSTSPLRGKTKLCGYDDLSTQAQEGPGSRCVIEEMQSCSICLEFQVVRADTFCKLASCDHEFCNNCLGKYAEAQSNTGAVTILCPQPSCKEPFTPHECSLFLRVDSFRKFTERQIEAAIPETERSFCPYPDCSALFIKPLIGDTAMSSAHPHSTAIGAVECCTCHRLFCLECQVPWHAEFTCQEFQGIPQEEKSMEDIRLHRLAKQSKWQRCYRCHCMVEHLSGCYHMSCRCGAHFCYLCGQEWTSNAHTCDNY